MCQVCGEKERDGLLTRLFSVVMKIANRKFYLYIAVIAKELKW